MALDWAPFVVCARGERPLSPRAISSAEGVGDRLRTAAFAELQAREAFRWAADRFLDAPGGLREAWRWLAVEEEKHLGWLLGRIGILGVGVSRRRVSLRLWESLISTASAREFSVLIAKAEERGRLAGERFRTVMRAVDPASAEVFGRIAEEEVAHIELTRRFYPDEQIAA